MFLVPREKRIQSPQKNRISVLGYDGRQLVELVQASCARGGSVFQPRGRACLSLSRRSKQCWRILQAPTDASPPLESRIGSALVDST